MDYFKVLAGVVLFISMFSIFITKDITGTQIGRIGSFFAFNLPICGRVMGWW